jgi:uncharacterized C2H2 Zn-finger protein
MTLKQALQKLHRSNTPLTRRRARRAVRVAVNQLLKDYPLLDKEGREKASKVITCPICRIPVKTWNALSTHIAKKHFHDMPYDTLVLHSCPACGKSFDSNRARNRHLAALARSGKLQEHVVQRAAEVAFGERNGE